MKSATYVVKLESQSYLLCDGVKTNFFTIDYDSHSFNNLTKCSGLSDPGGVMINKHRIDSALTASIEIDTKQTQKELITNCVKC